MWASVSSVIFRPGIGTSCDGGYAASAAGIRPPGFADGSRSSRLLAWYERGAWTAAVFFSIVESCELAGIDRFPYLRDVLRLLPRARSSVLPTLTPRAWAARLGEPAA